MRQSAKENRKNFEFPVDRQIKVPKVLVPQDKRGCSKEPQFFQLQGLQIELNLVPTMK
jgi:hypothetical protein